MSYSDNVAGEVLKISGVIVESSVKTLTSLIAEILRMMRDTNEHMLRTKELKLKSGIDISDMKPGEIKIKDLIIGARKNGDTVSSPETGFSKEDVNRISLTAKKYGLPVAFTERGDSMFVHVRSSDVPVLRRVLGDAMYEKLETKPQDIGNFKVQSWEIPFLTAELKNFNLNASFGKIQDGDYFCMYSRDEEKAILIARGEFIKKYNEVKKDFITDRDEEGFYTLKDIKSGKEISFDDARKSFRELSEEIQQTFGYEKNKADIAASKFGEEMLEGEEKRNFFDNPQNDTESIITGIEFESDDVYVSQYTCMRVVPKEDEIQRIVFADKEGKFAVISPEMTHSEMEKEIKVNLGVTDRKEMNSLISKAENTMLYYAKREDMSRYSSEYIFNEKNFDMRNPDVVKGMKREADNHIYTRSVPLDNIRIEIERKGKNEFEVTSDANHIETNENRDYSIFTDTRSALLSFSDKKKALHELEQILILQGVPANAASRAAHDTFAKALSQETEKIVYLEEVKSENAVYFSDNLKVEAEIYCSGKNASIDISNAELGKQQIADAFGVSEDKAEELFRKTNNKISDRQKNLLEGRYGYDCEDWDVGEASFVIGKIRDNGWAIPENMSPDRFNIDDFRKSGGNTVFDAGKVPVINTRISDDFDIGGM